VGSSIKCSKDHPQVHLVTQVGQPRCSGLSADAKRGLGNSCCKTSGRRDGERQEGEEGKKSALEPDHRTRGRRVSPMLRFTVQTVWPSLHPAVLLLARATVNIASATSKNCLITDTTGSYWI